MATPEKIPVKLLAELPGPIADALTADELRTAMMWAGASDFLVLGTSKKSTIWRSFENLNSSAPAPLAILREVMVYIAEHVLTDHESDKWSEIDRIMKRNLENTPGQSSGPGAPRAATMTSSAGHKGPIAIPFDDQRQGVNHGKWRLKFELGKGGQGIVWQAWNDKLSVAGALKEVGGSRETTTAQAGARFRKEREVLVKIRHPYVLRVLDYGDDPSPFMVTSIAPFGTAKDVSDAYCGDLTRFLRLARDIASGIRHVHDCGLIHRDIKPANIFIYSLDHAAIGDFGIVHDSDGESLTRTNDVSKELIDRPPAVIVVALRQ